MRPFIEWREPTDAGAANNLGVQDCVARDLAARHLAAQDLVARDLVARDLAARDLAAQDRAAQDLATQGRFSSRVIRLQCLPRLAAYPWRVSMAPRVTCVQTETFVL